MANQLTSNAEALRLFFNDDIYLVNDHSQNPFIEEVKTMDVDAAPIKPIMQQNEEPLPSLLVVEEPQPKLKKVWNFEFLGKNQKAILILVNDDINKVSSPQGTELLRKLVKAISLTNNDFALVNYANYLGATYHDLREFFLCELLISFGVNAKDLGLEDRILHEMTTHENTRLIFTKNLHHLDTDQPGKKLLWATLQKLNNE